MKPTLTVDTIALGKLIERASKASMDKVANVNQEMGYSAYAIQQKAVDLVPVDTGRLQGNILVDVKMWLKKFVYNNVDYATYIEYATPTGTGPHGGPQPYMRPAFYAELPNLYKRIKAVLRKPKKV